MENSDVPKKYICCIEVCRATYLVTIEVCRASYTWLLKHCRAGGWGTGCLRVV